MKNITDLHVVQVYVFAQDNFPYTQLNTKPSIDLISGNFGFQTTNSIVPVQQAGIVNPGQDFVSGVLKDSEKGNILIQQLRIEQRRISFAVAGDSAIADVVYKSIIETIKSIVPSFIPEILAKTQQSSCAVDLDVPFAKIFNPKFIEFLNQHVAKGIRIEGTAISVEPRSLRSLVTYTDVERKSPVTLLNKEFVMEPRIETSLSDQRYFTSSPTDSEAHLKLLEQFEKLFTDK